MNNEPQIYDKKGIPILPGDILKVFHFIAAKRREKRFMYKQAVEIVLTGKTKTPLLKFSHLNMKEEYYYQIMDGRMLMEYEIVQGYAAVKPGQDFQDRKRNA